MKAYVSQLLESCTVHFSFSFGCAAAIFVDVIVDTLLCRVLSRLYVKFAGQCEAKLPEEPLGRIIIKISWPALCDILLKFDGEHVEECQFKPSEVVLVAALGFFNREGVSHISLDITAASEEGESETREVG